jgi:hypothetical protein
MELLMEGVIPVITSADLATYLGVSEQSLRRKARRVRACRMIGKTMLFTSDDVDKIIALSTPENVAILADLKKEMERESEQRMRAPKVRGYVYFIGGGDWIKIGFAKNVSRRLEALRTTCPFPLTVLASLPGTAKRERELQNRFAAYRLSGEWFRFDGDLKAFVETLK